MPSENVLTTGKKASDHFRRLYDMILNFPWFWYALCEKDNPSENVLTTGKKESDHFRRLYDMILNFPWFWYALCEKDNPVKSTNFIGRTNC